MAVCHNLARTSNEKARPDIEIADNEPRPQPAAPLRRPYGNTPNNKRDNQERGDPGKTKNPAGSYTSKASVKSMGSNGKEERPYKAQEQPRQVPPHFKQRNSYQDRDNESVKGPNVAQSEPPKKEQPINRRRTMFDKAPEEPPPKKPEVAEAPVRSVAPPVVRPNLTPKTSVPDAPTVKPEPVAPQQIAPPPKEPMASAVRPASVTDVTPTKRLVPKNYLLEKMKVGDSFVMSVDAKAADCRITRGDFVCLTMAEEYALDYHSLCEDFVIDCNKDDQPAKLIPGETISYLNPDDCGWYRARCLNSTALALLDSGRIVVVTAADKCRKLPSKYEAIPEFCVVLASKAVQLGASVNCKILSQTPDGYKISMSDEETNALIGEGEVFRWLPTVEYQPPSPGIPEVARPPLVNGSKVLLVLADTLDKVFVRPADSESLRKYDDVLQQVLLIALNATPLTEPPRVGQTVIGKFTDGNHYRALVRRINVKQNKYQIEYAEYGNIEVSTLQDLYPCPADCDLSNVTTQLSMLKLAPHTELSEDALELIKDLCQVEELLLTLPNERETAPSGSEATLTIVRNKMDLGSSLLKMCAPEWKQMAEKGSDADVSKKMKFQHLEYTVLPKAGCSVVVTDVSQVKQGFICGFDLNDPNASLIFNELSEKMAKYCNSECDKEFYLPEVEELCIAQLPPYTEWYRAVLLNQVSGAGSDLAKLFYIDYGNIANVPANLLRKILPEFVTGQPAMALSFEIRDFPEVPSDEMIARALKHMEMDDEGRGTLKVRNCEKVSPGIYAVDAPELIAAMRG